MLAFYIAYPFLFVISKLSFTVLYEVSDFLYLILYKLIKYRKKVVFENLRKSFPTKTELEIREIAEKFYRYLCDIILETLRKISMTKAESNALVKFHLTPELERLVKDKRSLILLMGHYGNWELAGSSFTLNANIQLQVIYKTLSNPFFEDWMKKSRTMFGTKITKMENTLREMVASRNEPVAYAFIADQTPAPPAPYWLNFLNQDTDVFTGAEKLARKFNYPVFFINISRVKRGQYEIFNELMFENPKETSENEITETYFKRLQTEIELMPETWLWSHRRWKHRR